MKPRFAARASPAVAGADAFEATVRQEVLAEIAGTLERLLERLDLGLAELAAFEALPEERRYPPDRHRELLDAAAEALWHVTIQRDLMGFREHERFYRERRVPARVRVRIGMRPPPISRK